jgi:hypothetical protein
MIGMTKKTLGCSLGVSLVVGAVACGAASGPPPNDKTTVTMEKPAASSAPAANAGPDAGK